MIMRIIKKKGQSASEYIVLTTIIIAAVFVGGIYFKRGIQGRWRDAVDNLGDQYDPEIANGSVSYLTTGNAMTFTETVPDNINGEEGYWTLRLDSSNITQSTGGTLDIIP